MFSGADLRDCFYQFVAPGGRVQRNLLVDKLKVGQASFKFVLRTPRCEHCDKEGFVHVAFSSLAIGDSGACEYAQ